MTPSFCSLTDTKQSLQYTIKTHLSGPPMPKFEANMNYIPPSPPSSMKQCNKSATVKFHMELLLTTTTRKQSRSGATPIWKILLSNSDFFICKAGSGYFDWEKWVLDKSGLFSKRKSIFRNITVFAAKPPKNANFKSIDYFHKIKHILVKNQWIYMK